MSFVVISPKDKKSIRKFLGEESTCVFTPNKSQMDFVRANSFETKPKTSTSSVSNLPLDLEETPDNWHLTILIPEIPSLN